MPLPAFREDGYLPEGLHQATEAEVLFRFGSPTRRRRALALQLRNWLRLARAVQSRRFFVDGSFVTAKLFPGDLDAVVLLSDRFERNLNEGLDEAVELEEIMESRETGDLFAAADDADWSDWLNFFTKTRETDRRRTSCGGHPMITTVNEYEKAREELDQLQGWLEKLLQAHPGYEKRLTKAGVRKMIARLHEEIGVYEGSREFEKSPSP